MLELASLRRFAVSCVRHFPALLLRKFLHDSAAVTPKRINRVSIVLMVCVVGGIGALAGAILAQQAPSTNRAPVGAAHSPASGAPLSAGEAQSPGIEARLPASVQFYVHWRGTKTLDAVQSKNGLLRLWGDPDFAPIRRALTARAIGNSWVKANDKSVRADQLALLLPLFENEAIFGSVARKSRKGASGVADSGPGGGAHDAAGADGFLIYDGAGKAELIEKAEALLRKTDTGAPKLHAYALGKIKIESVERASGTDFSAQAGNYYLRASRQDLIEELRVRFDETQPASG